MTYNNKNTPANGRSVSEKIEVQRLLEENARLKALLSKHGIDQKNEHLIDPVSSSKKRSNDIQFTTAEKIDLFRRLFRGHTDVFPLRWESTKGSSGYSPACRNEWKPGICYKPQIKCADCSQRLLTPITNDVIYNHLAGKHVIGVYPLLADDSCYFLAVDFDEADWKNDALAFMHSCQEFKIPAALEISRSGNGAHIWLFFSEPIAAREARQLGAALISHTCDRTRQLSLKSYDRFFPNQDTMPRGGFGNLIALPLQKIPRENNRSVFVDENFVPHIDQWAFLASIQLLSKEEVEDAILKISGGRHPLDTVFITVEEENKPWETSKPISTLITGTLPEKLDIVLANQIFIAKAELPQQLMNRLIRLAAFQNPEFYKAQAMRLPVWSKPRIIGCAENFSEHIGLPRGCFDALMDMLKENGVKAEIQDERISGSFLSVDFTGTLKADQKEAVEVMLKHETGVLHAPTAFGKTVLAAAIIANRKISTLVLVHRTDLLLQWKERLRSFLTITENSLGFLGGTKKNLTGVLDIAVMQSLSRLDELLPILNNYGQIIIDECHHVSAFSFESIVRKSKARYVIGLTATPIRRDGHHPIIFMQCGPMRHSVAKDVKDSQKMEILPKFLPYNGTLEQASIQEVFRVLTSDEIRNKRIIADTLTAYQEGRKVLVLTERTEHLALLKAELGESIENCFILHGRLNRSQRNDVYDKLNALDDSAPRILLATGRLIGEGFDHPVLDTLVLAMPMAWRGTLEQYAGRLHRNHADKKIIRIFDYIEKSHPQLARMWTKRQRGYKAMGYEIKPPEHL